MINFIKKILGIDNLEYKIRLLERKNYWREKYGTIKKSTQFKSMGETKMDNKIWEEVFGDWGKIFARESYQESIVCGVCGNDKSKTARNKEGKTVCETTEKYCKENKTIQEIQLMYGMKKTNMKKKPTAMKKKYKGFSKLPEGVQKKINKKLAKKV